MDDMKKNGAQELKEEHLDKVTAGTKQNDSPKEKTRICPNCGRTLPAYQINCCCGW